MASGGLAFAGYLALARQAGRTVSARAGAEPARPEGLLVWLLVGPKGRVATALQALERLRANYGAFSVLVTVEAGRVPSRPLPDWAIWQVMPPDTGAAVARFLAHWQPDLCIVASEVLRPLLLMEAQKAQVPQVMVDALAPSGDGLAGWWERAAMASVLRGFGHILAASRSDLEGLRKLTRGAAKIELSGYLAEESAVLTCNERERDYLAQLFAARPVWLAARVVPAEIEAIVTAHRQASLQAHRLLMIVVPADPGEADEFEAACNAEGWSVVRRSRGEEPAPEDQVYVADTTDEMGLWYRLAPITFLGRSLVRPGGGQSPYEPAALGSSIIYGPHVGRHRPAFARFTAAHAARRVSTPNALGQVVSELLAPDRAASLAHRAWEVSSSGAAVTDRVMELVADYLDKAERA